MPTSNVVLRGDTADQVDGFALLFFARELDETLDEIRRIPGIEGGPWRRKRAG